MAVDSRNERVTALATRSAVSLFGGPDGSIGAADRATIVHRWCYFGLIEGSFIKGSVTIGQLVSGNISISESA